MAALVFYRYCAGGEYFHCALDGASDHWENPAGIALALVLGGALGNLLDRVFLGYVVDFIDVYYLNYHWPAFNVADSAITVGAILLIIESLCHRDQSHERKN